MDHSVEILFELLPDGLYALDFTQEDYDALLDNLALTYSLEELLRNRGAIKAGITEYFAETFQEVAVSFVEGHVRLKKRFLLHRGGEALDRMMHEAILDLLDIADDDAGYRRAEFLLILPETVRGALLARFHGVPDEEARSCLRHAIETVFELQPKDIVLFLRSRIYIRFHVPPRPLAEGADRRFAGQDADAMATLFETHFPDGAWEEIEAFLPDTLDDTINFSVIDNRTFNKTYITAFRNIVEIVILERVEGLSDAAVEGLTGYVLRHYFDDILAYTARELLYYVEERDRNAEAFVKYYKDEIIIDAEGKKVRKHAIIDAKKQSWNYSAILSVLMQYKQAKNRAAQQEEKCAAAAERVEALRNEVGRERLAKQQCDTKAAELSELYRYRHSSHADPAPDSEETELLESLKHAREQVQTAARRYRNKQTELENWKKQLKMQEDALAEVRQQNANVEEMIELIVNALAVTFAKR